MTTDAKILSALRANADGVSGADLAEQLGISRAAIWAHIEELRRLGYDIEASPHLGYRLVSAPDVLHADDLLARLGKTKVIGRDIRVFEETTSTNDVIEKLARDGVKEGVVVFAESQTKGRGRLGRKWISPARKGLWFSVLLRPDLRPQEATQLTVASATALRRAIQSETGLNAEIKWPNDILVRRKKGRGHPDRTERGTGPGEARHPRHRRGCEPGRGRISGGSAQDGDLAEDRSGPDHFPRGTGRGHFAGTGRRLRARSAAAHFAAWPMNGRRIAQRLAAR